MDPQQFFAASRLVIVAGKGGVGKTTVTAALALAAARRGFDALIVDVEGKSALASMFAASELSYDETQLLQLQQSTVRGRRITPDAALAEYLRDHGLRRVLNRLVRTGALDVVATAAPGIEDILVLGKVKQLERAEGAGLIVLDAPAAGHAIKFLESAIGLLDAVSVGPIRTQAAEVAEMLRDPTRCSVMLVTLAEETPVNELAETAFALEDRVGVKLGPVVANAVYPVIKGLDVDPGPIEDADALRGAAAFRRARQQLQAEQIARLAALLPLPIIQLPFLFRSEIDLGSLHLLADALCRGIEQAVP